MMSLLFSLLGNKRLLIPFIVSGLLLASYIGFKVWLGVYTKSVKDQSVASLRVQEQAKEIKSYQNREVFENESKSKDHIGLVDSLRGFNELRD